VKVTVTSARFPDECAIEPWTSPSVICGWKGRVSKSAGNAKGGKGAKGQATDHSTNFVLDLSQSRIIDGEVDRLGNVGKRQGDVRLGELLDRATTERPRAATEQAHVEVLSWQIIFSALEDMVEEEKERDRTFSNNSR
jgi:hypothetical protein